MNSCITKPKQSEEKEIPAAGSQNLSVTAIKEGTVIDHITAGKAIFLLRILKLESHRKQVTVGLNLPSTKMKFKDLVKVEGWELSENETSQIAIFSPKATISIIRNFRVVNKYVVSLPPVIEEFVICPNPTCITNHEKTRRLFYLTSRKEIQLRCKYCEKTFSQSEIIY